MAKVHYTDYDGQTDGERVTTKTLSQLPDDWLVICNKILVLRRDFTREVDFIVVGNNSVFAIDEKSWTGTIRGTNTSWSRANGESESSPLNKVTMVAKTLAGHLRDRTPYLRESLGDTPFVRGCVSLTRQDQQPNIQDPRSPDLVLLLRNIVPRLLNLDNESGATITQNLKNQIETVLVDLRDRPKRPTSINEYTITSDYDGIGGSRICRAVHSEGMERSLSIFNVGPDDQETRDFCLQEFRTLQRLAPLGITPQVYDYFRWSDDYIVVPSSIPEGISIGSLPLPTSLPELSAYLKCFRAVFDSLSQIHSFGIIHRAIGQEHIYINKTSGSLQAVLTGFYAARKPDNTVGFSIGPALTALRIEDSLSAPEITLGYEYADFTSDTYSASLMMLELLSDVPADLLTSDPNILRATDGSPIWAVAGKDIAQKLKKFFEDTLGYNPPRNPEEPIQGRLTAPVCRDRLTDIIQLCES